MRCVEFSRGTRADREFRHGNFDGWPDPNPTTRVVPAPALGGCWVEQRKGNPVGHLNNSWDWAYAMLLNIANSSEHSVEEILAKGGIFEEPGLE